jgi:hypothetical protein
MVGGGIPDKFTRAAVKAPFAVWCIKDDQMRFIVRNAAAVVQYLESLYGL